MLVHICCSVDSHFFLKRLREDFPDETLTAFFYDPNIHPYSEYSLRLLDVKRSCRKLGVKLIEGPYDFEVWLDAVKGYEREPEKGMRCEICFDRRFEISAKKAGELGEKRMTTTLLVSPKKSQEQLLKTGRRVAADYGVEFVYVDYRSSGGTQLQQQVSKKEALYRQNYCGCLYALAQQREQQKMPAAELFSPICSSILPASVEERLNMYEKRLSIEDKGGNYRIFRHKFMNYRLKYGWVKQKGEILPSHILPYSYMKRRRCKGKTEYIEDGLGRLLREEILLLTLERYNRLISADYSCIRELIYAPPSFEEDLKVRDYLGMGTRDISPVIILERIPEGSLEVCIDSEIYPDVREKLVVM